MRVSVQASHSICSICTCNHEVVVFYGNPHMLLFNIVPRTFSPVMLLVSKQACKDIYFWGKIWKISSRVVHLCNRFKGCEECDLSFNAY